MKRLGMFEAILIMAVAGGSAYIAEGLVERFGHHAISEPADAGPLAHLGSVVVDRSRILMLDLRGADFEDARGKGCPMEAFVELPDGGDYPVLRFRCAVYGGP